jgi:hypothetical protein
MAGFDPYHLFQPGLDFESAALAVFRHQAAACDVYRRFLDAWGLPADAVGSSQAIPCLPVSFFRTHAVQAGDRPASLVFKSSGTTSEARSRHFIADPGLYRQSLLAGFRHFYGEPNRFRFLALVPPAARQQGSSLAYMIDEWMKQSAFPENGYYAGRFEELADVLHALRQKREPVLLIGLTWALLDFADFLSARQRGGTASSGPLTVMETGGMKGKRKELVREEVHALLCEAFNVPAVHSEYGMTELLSQAYSKGQGLFECPPWMRVSLRDTNDPLSPAPAGRTGGINVIDLANYHSCSFIATQDLGRMHAGGVFEVLGRFDASEVRGCNLMVE